MGHTVKAGWRRVTGGEGLGRKWALRGAGGVSSALVALPAWANMTGTASSRIPFTDWLIDFYQVTNNVYIPFAAVAILVGTVWAVHTGRVRIGEASAKMVFCIGLLGLGVGWILNQAGASASIALVG